MSSPAKKLPKEALDRIRRFQTNPPVRVAELCRSFGVDVRMASLPSGVSGTVSRENSGYVIRVNRYETRERQRFTIAHELAHFLLHREFIDARKEGLSDNILYRSGAPIPIEYEANSLAAKILIPKGALLESISSRNQRTLSEADIDELASKFAVSRTAMEIRLGEIL